MRHHAINHPIATFPIPSPLNCKMPPKFAHLESNPLMTSTYKIFQFAHLRKSSPASELLQTGFVLCVAVLQCAAWISTVVRPVFLIAEGFMEVGIVGLPNLSLIHI